MDAINSNPIAKDMRAEMLSKAEVKNRFWIDLLDEKVRKRLQEKVKFIGKTQVTTLNEDVAALQKLIE
jgi:hypothetical protein